MKRNNGFSVVGFVAMYLFILNYTINRNEDEKDNQ